MNKDIPSSQERTIEFARVSDLEKLLSELNENLAEANEKYLEDSSEKYTKIFVIGALRSGTTLLTQWLANSGIVAYPTNLLSRFYGAPLVGAKIQQLLTDPHYNFRNEILDFNSGVNFSSENGKTQGALAPNEFWYFWRRFLPFDDRDYMPAEELKAKANLAGLRDELNALANIFEKPFAMKGMIMNQNIPELAEQFKKSLFIWIKRDPVFNIQSALEARKRQYGDINTWYSFKIKEYDDLKSLPPLESVAGQIAAINKSIEQDLLSLSVDNKLTIDYKDFCERPEYYYELIKNKVMNMAEGKVEWLSYQGEKKFKNTNQWRLKEFSKEQVSEAYEYALKFK